MDSEELLQQILEKLEGRKAARFTQNTYTDQPLLQTGKQFRQQHEQKKSTPEAPEGAGEQRQEKRTVTSRPSRDRRTRSRNFRDNPFASQAYDIYELFGEDRSHIPERIREMRDIEGLGTDASRPYLSKTANRIFWEQAHLMADYEDNYIYEKRFVRYYPCYAAMNTDHMRGYFTWRAQLRRGTSDFSHISFTFVHVYEILCGAGIDNHRDGFLALKNLYEKLLYVDAYESHSLRGHLRLWMHDYVIYHNLVDSCKDQLELNEVRPAVYTLLQAQAAVLQQLELTSKIDNHVEPQMPNDADLLEALRTASSKKIARSKIFDDAPELFGAIARRVFEKMVAHCSRRRQTDFVEGYFGTPTKSTYLMFSSAIFYDPEIHPDCTVELDPSERYSCRSGKWTQMLICAHSERSAELAALLHGIDCALRNAIDHPHPLKPQKLPAFAQKIIDEAVRDELNYQQELEARRVTIDYSKLDGIRAAAEQVQEALLVDEERMDSDEETAGEVSRAGEGLSGEAALLAEELPSKEHGSDEASREAPEMLSARDFNSETGAAEIHLEEERLEPQQTHGLTTTELAILSALLDGLPYQELVSASGQLLSTSLDTMTEKLFDLVGDVVIEFDGDEPFIIEDYRDDVAEIISEGSAAT